MESRTRLPPAPILPVIDLGSSIDLLIMHGCEADDFKGPGSRRYFYLDGVPFTLVQKTSPDGRSRRYEPLRGICIFACHQLVSDFFILVDIQNDDFRTKRDSI